MLSDEQSQRKLIEILKILSEHREPLGARVLANELKRRGFDLNERTVRYHMRILDERGLTENLGYDGRLITPQGREEISKALLSNRMDFINTKIESLIFKMDFNPETGTGNIVVNLGIMESKHFHEAAKIMKRVISAGFAVCPMVKILTEGQSYENYTVPQDKVMIATVCSITLDGIIHKAGIPVSPKFGGVVQVVNGTPLRFSDAITYAGSTLDPHDIMAVKGLSTISKAVQTGTGQILANFREIPMEALKTAKQCLSEVQKFGVRGTLMIGEPNQPVLGVTPGMGRVGVCFVGGTNPLAAIGETGFPIQTKAIEGLMRFEEMIPANELTTSPIVRQR